MDFRLPIEVADAITAATLRDCWRMLMDSIKEEAKDFHKPHQRENLRDSYAALFAIEKTYHYITGEELSEETEQWG